MACTTGKQYGPGLFDVVRVTAQEPAAVYRFLDSVHQEGLADSRPAKAYPSTIPIDARLIGFLPRTVPY